MPHTEPTPFTPYFNLELFLQTCEESRLPGQEMETLFELWGQWAHELETRQVNAHGVAHLAVWLTEAVERDIDETWAASPTAGFRKHALAQTMCMCAVQEFVPEVEDMGCAPLPRPTEDLATALATEGLPCKSGDALILGRRYAVVTAHPFRGGCETCSLQKSCPRNSGGPHSVTLPGHE